MLTAVKGQARVYMLIASSEVERWSLQRTAVPPAGSRFDPVCEQNTMYSRVGWALSVWENYQLTDGLVSVCLFIVTQSFA